MSADTHEEPARSDAPARTRNLMPAWPKGVSGNPGGVPRGKAKLQGSFINALAEDFAAHGKSAIEAARMDDPNAYLRTIASLMPKDVTITAKPFGEFSDDDLAAAIELIQRYIAAGANPLGAGTAIEGEATLVLPAVPEAAGVPRGGEALPAAAADGGESGGQDAVGGG